MTNKTLETMADVSTAGGTKDTDIAYVVRPSTHTDYKTTLGDLKTYMTPSKPQIVATHNGVAQAVITGGGTDRATIVRIAHFVGCQAVSQLQIGHAGHYLPTGGQETLMINDFTAETYIEIVSPSVSTPMFGPVTQVQNIPNNTPHYLSIVGGVDFAAGEMFYTRITRTISDTSYNLPINGQKSSHIAGYSDSSISSTITGGTGTLTTTGKTIRGGVTPYLILGIPAKPMASVVYIGDSIADGIGASATTSTRDSSGFIQYGLASVNGYAVPWHSQAKNAVTAAAFKKNTAPKMRASWKYATHLLVEAGNNDIATQTLATIQATLLDIWTSAKNIIGPYGKPLHVTQCTFIPRTTSSNSFINATGQTVTTGYEDGGIRTQLNSWIKAQVGFGLLDAVIDVNATCEDPANLGKWISNGTAGYATADGTHPTEAFHQAMGVLVNNWALTIKP